MQENINSHLIAPDKVIRGESAWDKAKFLIPKLCKKPLILGRSSSTKKIRQDLFNDLKEIGVNPIHGELINDCCEGDLKRLYLLSKQNKCDGIISAGGGKVLDSGKLIAHRLKLPAITIPLSASTCAGWTALSNIYSAKGEFIEDIKLSSCPKLLIFDHKIIKTAPKKTLASGIADALAKWHESSITSGDSDDGLVQQAVQMARVLRDQLLIDSEKAYLDSESKEWVRVAEGCALTAGLIGGLGGERCRTAAAHAIHNGLTQLEFSDKALHGEIVGFGILVQLKLEEMHSDNQLSIQKRSQLRTLFKKLKLPMNLYSLGLSEISYDQIKKASVFACKVNSEINYLPFKINNNLVLQAILETHDQDVKANSIKARGSLVS